jgi:hypothetical protein
MPARGSRVATAAVLAAVGLALAGAASAKPFRITLIRPAAAPRAHAALTLTLSISRAGRPYVRAGYRPLVYLVDETGNPVETFHGALTTPGRFRVIVVFPHGGAWRYVVADPVTGEWVFPVRVGGE